MLTANWCQTCLLKRSSILRNCRGTLCVTTNCAVCATWEKKNNAILLLAFVGKSLGLEWYFVFAVFKNSAIKQKYYSSKFSRGRKRILARKCPKYRIYDNRSAVELNLQSIDDNLNIWYDFPINQAKTDYCQACNLKSITR